ncbi:hypothetical protein T03_13175 [Trichinella britovi]|uniref:Uncharacterized protein n=1 Tax=Trichinella britovi TaxID=45882 RepID=A0A0V1AP16_TRIBR|nr:hypothetical protein T03_13175 [Trichinella britovi]
MTQLTELDKSTGTVHKLFNGCKMEPTKISVQRKVLHPQADESQ